MFLMEKRRTSPRVVVVGTGFGAAVHVPALQRVGFEVVALVGRNAAKTKQRAFDAGIAHAAASLAEVLDRDEIDAVTIATPPSTHCEIAIESFAHGLHVLCE